MRQLILSAIAVAGVITMAGAQTRGPAPADTIRMRQANYKQMGAAMKGLNDEIRAGAPSIDAVRRHAAIIATHAPMLLRWFPPGSGAETGVRTRAKAEIWSDPQGFRRAGAALLIAARQMDAAARQGDIPTIRAASRALAQGCSGCHDRFRAPER